MQAVIYTQYGPPDVFQPAEVEKPTPKEDEVLVKIHAASANAVDWRAMAARPFFIRMDMGLLKPKTPILGADIAGRVEAVGSSVTQFQPGDDVFGEIDESGFGGFAEYVAFPEEAPVVLKPANVPFEDAAATPVVGFTALQGLRDDGQIQAGQRVLINGATGGVGSFAVQIAKSFEAEVTGVCSTENMDLVRSIGADHVIAYDQEDFSRNGQQYDLIFDVVANRPLSDFKRVLSPNGNCVVAGFASLTHMLFQVTLVGARMSRTGSQKFGHMGSAVPNKKDLLYLGELLESSQVKPVIYRRYPLSETAEAMRYLYAGHARGKVVINVEPDN